MSGMLARFCLCHTEPCPARRLRGGKGSNGFWRNNLKGFAVPIALCAAAGTFGHVYTGAPGTHSPPLLAGAYSRNRVDRAPAIGSQV